MPNKTSDYISYKEATRVAYEILDKDPQWSLFIIVGINVGLRFCDLSKLTLGDLRKSSFKVTEKKNKNKRIIVSNEQIQDILKYFKDKPDTDIIMPYSIQYVDRKLKNIFWNPKLNLQISSHSLRKTFAREIYNLTPSEHTLYILMEIFGHKNLVTTRKYLGIRQEEIRSIYMNLGKISLDKIKF